MKIKDYANEDVYTKNIEEAHVRNFEIESIICKYLEFDLLSAVANPKIHVRRHICVIQNFILGGTYVHKVRSLAHELLYVFICSF